MKIAFTFLSLLLFIGGVLPAQTLTSVTSPSSGFELVATFPVQIGFDRSPDGTYYRTSVAEKSCITIIGAFRSSYGQVEYRINTDSIQFSGDGDVIDHLPTGLAYEWLAQEAVLQGTIRGLTVVSSDCSVPTIAPVTAVACVTRQRLGSNTTITPCTYDQFSTWQFAVCSQSGSGATSVIRVPYENVNGCGEIGSTCEPTCPNYLGGAVLR